MGLAGAKHHIQDGKRQGPTAQHREPRPIPGINCSGNEYLKNVYTCRVSHSLHSRDWHSIVTQLSFN